jgi:CDP-diglyceride synthetase
MTRRPKLTIAALMALVAFCAATFAALRASSPYLASAMVSVTVLVLLGSVVASLLGRHRAAWSGFAIFGWGYFILTFTSPFRDVVRPHLFTSVAIVESYRHVHPELRVELMTLNPLPGAGVPIRARILATVSPTQVPAPQFVALAGGGPRPIIGVTNMGINSSYVPSGPNQFYSFECSAHAAVTLVFAGLGWLFASWVARRAMTTPQ